MPDRSLFKFFSAVLEAQDTVYQGPVLFAYKKAGGALKAVFTGAGAEEAVAFAVKKMTEAGLTRGHSRGVLPFAEVADVLRWVTELKATGHVMHAFDNVTIGRTTDGHVSINYE